jgi:hypothetical protein
LLPFGREERRNRDCTQIGGSERFYVCDSLYISPIVKRNEQRFQSKEFNTIFQ